MEEIMWKRTLFLLCAGIIVFGWVFGMMDKSQAKEREKPSLTSSFKGTIRNVNPPTQPRPMSRQNIIWDNGGTTPSSNLYSSQNDTCYPFVSQVADDFIFELDMVITDVHWWGGFWNPPPNSVDPTYFYIYFYADDGTGNAPTGAGLPDPAPTALATYYFSGISGLPLDPNGFYEYQVDLNPPFSASANTKYWIAIQEDTCYPPQWGWANTGAIRLHSAVQGFPVLSMPFWTDIDPAVDMAFYLTGAPPDSLYWKPPYEDYAPSGMPDLSQWQDQWYKLETEQPTFCGPVAVANCFKWFDSKYNVPPGVPGDGMDMFPLVRQYIDGIGGMLGPWDDHDPWNMDHAQTPWQFGATPPPPPTLPQPFVPGAQPPGPMPPWGELVERLAWYFNTDGVQTGYCAHSGTDVNDMYAGIQNWFTSEQFPDGSTLADTLCVNLWQMPTFALVESLVEKCEDVILLLGFWFYDGTQWWRCGGHYVTVAGINSQDNLIGISDPAIDNAELGGRGRVLDGRFISHSHGQHDPTVHNDEGNVSHDIYSVINDPISPGGLWELADYTASFPYDWCEWFGEVNVPPEFEDVTQPWDYQSPIVTEVEYAIQISPWDYRGDVNIPGGDGVVDIGDVVFLINYLYKGGPAPSPLSEGDANCDGVVDLGDIVFLINYLYKNGAVPRCCDP